MAAELSTRVRPSPNRRDAAGKERFLALPFLPPPIQAPSLANLPSLLVGRSLDEVASPAQLRHLTELFAGDKYLLNAKVSCCCSCSPGMSRY
jgi:hypothetical protein